MAINRAEGFGHFTSTSDYAAKGHNTSGGNVSFFNSGGPGNRGYFTVGLNSTVHEVLTAAKSTVWAHIRFKAARAHTQLIEFRNATNTHVIVEGFEDGSITVIRADSLFGVTPFSNLAAVTLNTSDPNVWRAATWHHMVVKLVVSASVGVVQVWIDGGSVLTITGANTYGGAGVTSVSSVGYAEGSFGGSTNSYADLVITDTDATDDFGNTTTYTGSLGDVAVYEYVSPTDGDLLNWTRSSGAGTWSSHMNQNPQDGDTTYLKSSNAAEEVCFFAPNVDTSLGTVLAVKETICHRKESASFAQVKLFYRDNAATNHYGPIKTAPTTYIFDELLAEVDPKDAGTWTNTRVNNTQMGIRHDA